MSSEPDKDGSQQPEIKTYEGVSTDWIVVGRTSLMSSMFTPDGCKMWNELTTQYLGNSSENGNG